ncbi:hypothetical protein RUMLAC_01204 [[Ruminococcus] lactaris ATCC 29176]|uniref:Uncharacterized protein n=1 Tax=[Ruminococcus] lactaris ATCC 29176 TaxID=471875 RepID=B5CP13_9FIRM|nr:hypothetical protein RUMLAC_01204 [[Ruminococcus] lactaris ATCC 29176]
MGNDEKKISADFNPHFRKGSDRFLIFCLRLLNIFQSTLPQGK